MCLVFGLLVCFVQPKGNTKEKKDELFLVIKTSKNYVIGFNFSGKYYIPIKEHDYCLFDIIKVSGKVSSLSFSHFEEGFNFKNYLNDLNVNYKINCYSNSLVFKNFIRENYFYYALKYIKDSEAYIYLSHILFSESLDRSFDLYYELMEHDLTNFVSLSSMSLYFVFNFNKYLFKRAKFKEKYCDIFNLILTFGLLIFTNMKFSICRILVVNLLYLLKVDKKLKLSSFEVNLFFGGACLVLDPYLVLQKGFYISYLIIFINNFSKPFLSRFKKGKKNIIRMLLVCFALLPITLYETHTLSVNKLLFQIPLIYLSNILVLLSFFLFVCPFFGFVLNYVVLFYLEIIKVISRYNLLICVGDFNIYLVCLYYFILVLFILFKSVNFKCLSISSVFAMSLLLVSCCIPTVVDKFEVHFIDVSQGDATLVRYKKKNILIDTGGLVGNDLAKECLIPYFNKNKIYFLDYVFITHDDFDHCGALNSLLENFKVNKVIYNTDNFLNVDIGGLLVENLNPNPEFVEENDKSLVLKFKLKDKTFLLMGDSSKKVENMLLDNGVDVKADYLKVGHHGSSSSSSYKFLKEVSPSLGIISCGENNKYHHPNSDVIKNLNLLKIKYVRTDEQFTYVIKV